MAMDMATGTGTVAVQKAARSRGVVAPRVAVISSSPVWLVAASICGVLGSPSAEGAEWRASPSLGLRSTYSDNVGLSTRGRESSDLVTEVAPGVAITGRGARLNLDAQYALVYRAYANNSSSNGHNHSLRSKASFDAFDRKLFLDASASIAQQNISTLGALSASDVNLTPNRTEVRQATFSPYWVSRLGTFAALTARYTWSRAESDGATSVLNTDTQSASLQLASGSRFSDLGWSLAYSKQEIESSRGRFASRSLESVTGTVRYRVLPTLFALGSLGHDENVFGSARGSTGGDFYSVGLEWAPSLRTKVSGEIGERYFGNTARLSAEHRTRLSTWNLSYNEQIIATPGQFRLPVSLDTAGTLDRLFLSQIPDPIERQQVVQAYIVQNGLPPSLDGAVDFLTEQVSLSKRLQGAFGLRGVRGSLLLSLFRDQRVSQTTGTSALATDPFALGQDVTQAGYSGIVTWRFSETTAGSFSAGQTRIKQADDSRTDLNSTLRVGVTHRLSPRMTGGLEYRWVDRDSSLVAQDVRENAITGTLNMSF